MTLNPIEAGVMDMNATQVGASPYLRNSYALAAIALYPTDQQVQMMRNKLQRLMSEGMSEDEAHFVLMGYPPGGPQPQAEPQPEPGWDIS